MQAFITPENIIIFLFFPSFLCVPLYVCKVEPGSFPTSNTAFSIEGGCEFRESKTITPFAYRVHAHAHSTVISGFYKKSGSEQWSLIGSRSPQDPQAFYPALHRPTVGGGDTLAARCLYDTHEEEHDVHIGYVCKCLYLTGCLVAGCVVTGCLVVRCLVAGCVVTGCLVARCLVTRYLVTEYLVAGCLVAGCLVA